MNGGDWERIGFCVAFYTRLEQDLMREAKPRAIAWHQHSGDFRARIRQGGRFEAELVVTCENLRTSRRTEHIAFRGYGRSMPEAVEHLLGQAEGTARRLVEGVVVARRVELRAAPGHAWPTTLFGHCGHDRNAN